MATHRGQNFKAKTKLRTRKIIYTKSHTNTKLHIKYWYANDKMVFFLSLFYLIFFSNIAPVNCQCN